ncbi:MAG: sterol desaturase family protein [Myxococcota bacterium]
MKVASLGLLAVLLILVSAEILWSRRRGRRVYSLRESLSNVTMMAVNQGLRPLALAWSLLVLSLIEPSQVFRLPETAGIFLLTFLVADFAYYWHHRILHRVSFLWAMHHTHHSSPWMNFTTALRLNWVAKFVSPIFFFPLVAVGFSPMYLAASLAIGLVYQLFLHTEAIGRLGWFEGKLFNTPSAHRVHHGSNLQYIDKNYGGVLIVWDRLFGTYEPEGDAVCYGVTTGFLGHNPFVAQFQPLWRYLRGGWRTERELTER